MKVDSLKGMELDNYLLVIGDCSTNHIEKFLDTNNVVSRQIQGGIGCEVEIDNVTAPSAIFLFVSWGNAISVIEDESLALSRIRSHVQILSSLLNTGKPLLMIDRHGFLDRYASKELLNGRENIPYPEALRLGWKPQNIFKQMERRLKYRECILEYLDINKNYFDLADFVGISTYRHESGECKNNVVNVAPWHYDIPSYEYAALAFKCFLSQADCSEMIKNWELGVLNLKANREKV